MFTYNFKRLLNLIGIVLFKKLIIALKNGNIEDIKAEIVAFIVVIFYLGLLYLPFLNLKNKNYRLYEKIAYQTSD